MGVGPVIMKLTFSMRLGLDLVQKEMRKRIFICSMDNTL